MSTPAPHSKQAELDALWQQIAGMNPTQMSQILCESVGGFGWLAKRHPEDLSPAIINILRNAVASAKHVQSQEVA